MAIRWPIPYKKPYKSFREKNKDIHSGGSRQLSKHTAKNAKNPSKLITLS